MRMPACLVPLLLLALAGCGSANNPPTVVTAPAVVNEEWFVITSQPDLLAEAERLSKSNDKAAIAQLFQELPQIGGYTDLSTDRLLERQGHAIAVQAHTHIDFAANTSDDSIGAAILLCRLKDTDGRKHLIRALQHADQEQQLRVLHALSGLVDSANDASEPMRLFLLGEPNIAVVLKSLLGGGDGETLPSAIVTCKHLKLPDLNRLLLSRLEHFPDNAQAPAFSILAEGELSEKLFEFASHKLSNRELTDWEYSHTDLASAFVERGTPAQRAEAASWLKRLWESEPPSDPELRRHAQGNRYSLAAALVKSPAMDDAVWLDKQVNSTDGIFSEQLFAAWAKQQGDNCRERCLEMLRDVDLEKRVAAIRALGQQFAGSRDDQLALAIAHATVNPKHWVVAAACEALPKIQGPEADRQFQELLEKVSPSLRTRYRWQASGKSLADFKPTLLASGIITEAEFDTAAAQLAKNEFWQPSPEDLLDSTDRMVLFDFDDYDIPPHDELLQQFAQATNGALQPQDVSQELHPSYKPDEGPDYTLRFVHHGRLYQGRLRNTEGWFDVERIAAMVNRALEDSGRTDRFVALGGPGEHTSMIYADPAQFAALAKECFILIDDETNAQVKAAMQQAIDTNPKR